MTPSDVPWALPAVSLASPNDSTHPEVRGREPVAGRHVVCGGGVRVEGVDVGEQGAHLRGDAGAKVLGRQAVEVTGKEREREGEEMDVELKRLRAIDRGETLYYE